MDQTNPLRIETADNGFIVTIEHGPHGHPGDHMNGPVKKVFSNITDLNTYIKKWSETEYKAPVTVQP